MKSSIILFSLIILSFNPSSAAVKGPCANELARSTRSALSTEENAYMNTLKSDEFNQNKLLWFRNYGYNSTLTMIIQILRSLQATTSTSPTGELSSQTRVTVEIAMSGLMRHPDLTGKEIVAFLGLIPTSEARTKLLDELIATDNVEAVIILGKLIIGREPGSGLENLSADTKPDPVIENMNAVEPLILAPENKATINDVAQSSVGNFLPTKRRPTTRRVLVSAIEQENPMVGTLGPGLNLFNREQIIAIIERVPDIALKGEIWAQWLQSTGSP